MLTSWLRDISIEMRQLDSTLITADPKSLMLFARRLAQLEMKLQGFRSMLEARLFEAEIDNLEAELKPEKKGKSNSR